MAFLPPPPGPSAMVLRTPLSGLGKKRQGKSPEATREAMIPINPFFDSSWSAWLRVVEFSLEETMFWQALEKGEARHPAELQVGDQEGVGRALYSLSPY